MSPNRLALLRKIKAGEKHTLANKALAPLVASGYITVTYKPNSVQYASAKLTAWGESTIKFFDKKSR